MTTATAKPDWRIGKKCKMKYLGDMVRTDEDDRYGKIVDVLSSGTGEIYDQDGILAIRLRSGKTILDKADKWVTA